MTKTSARPTAWILATLLLPSLAHAADGAFLEFFELRESLWFLVPFLLSVVILTRVERGVRSLRAALKITPDDQLARRRLAQALTQTGAYKTALEMYDSLIAKSRRDARLHAAKAGILLNMGRAKDAVAAITKAVRMAPREKKFLELLLQAQEKAGYKSGARSTRRKLRALGKDSR